ncbi:MAG: Glu/Leu/Phe/Val dehydrogenase [Meiothermus sp.]|uniref:Glu/Leu/Phe/Val family dehydrogenase n=1 Tax=Meiothermus sp. TaxID=1955249 RepID=UPI0025FBC982|nr:Glu/Leu/Phe/Val dehydrogenase [Meiothermus sp.]MCS7068343.1 Glu/Leu/Phe/Val dehydrogenase [Meiothermus sp.]MCX7600732.1 Glu/Leu/Phe/Val dehydrogenase [Meiothermus sp.]MDW8426627.1 Glu/Leu/Phe/Val dehydrogenase [Meiothermus sp.]
MPLRNTYRPPGDASLWDSFLRRLESTIKVARIHPATIEYLTHPKRSVGVSLPVVMDDGSVRNFTAYRVIHNIARGPALGGVRYHPEVGLGQTCGMAAWMTLKSAVFGLPFGGSAGGVVVDPDKLSRRELERVSRRYVTELIELIGPDEDVLAPDLGTNETVMAWFQDTFTMSRGQTTLSAVTGKPTQLGGVAVRDEGGGQGLVYVLSDLAQVFGWPVVGASVAIQGFGQVGSAVARYAVREGLRVVAVSTSRGGVYNPEGLDVAALEQHYAERGHLEGFPGGQPITNHELLTLKVNYLVPAAVEGVINERNARQIAAQVVLEGANGAITPEAEYLLKLQGIQIVPDILANGGGLVLSYLEWVQDLSMLFFEEGEVQQKLREFVHQSLQAVLERAKPLQGDLRAGAYALALERINEASRLRGVYP